MKYRKVETSEGLNLTLGKDERSNDELMKEFEGSKNTILHTSAPGSPFGVIEKLSPNKSEIYSAATLVAKYSQAWRDKKSDIMVDVFTGKDVSKPKGYKPGTWKIGRKSKNKKTIKVKKEDILKVEKE